MIQVGRFENPTSKDLLVVLRGSRIPEYDSSKTCLLMVVGKGIFSTRRQAVMAKMRRDANHNQRVENRDVKCHPLGTRKLTFGSQQRWKSSHKLHTLF